MPLHFCEHRPYEFGRYHRPHTVVNGYQGAVGHLFQSRADRMETGDAALDDYLGSVEHVLVAKFFPALRFPGRQNGDHLDARNCLGEGGNTPLQHGHSAQEEELFGHVGTEAAAASARERNQIFFSFFQGMANLVNFAYFCLK